MVGVIGGFVTVCLVSGVTYGDDILRCGGGGRPIFSVCVWSGGGRLVRCDVIVWGCAVTLTSTEFRCQ